MSGEKRNYKCYRSCHRLVDHTCRPMPPLLSVLPNTAQVVSRAGWTCGLMR